MNKSKKAKKLMSNALILNDLAKALGVRIGRLEKEVGASNAAISKLIERKAKLSYNIIEKITRRYPQVNKDWLETGEGEMFIEEQAAAPQASNSLYEQVIAAKDELVQVERERVKDKETIVLLYKSMADRERDVTDKVLANLDLLSRDVVKIKDWQLDVGQKLALLTASVQPLLEGSKRTSQPARKAAKS